MQSLAALRGAGRDGLSVQRVAELGVRMLPEARQATADEANLLGIQKGAQVTHIHRTYFSEDGRPVETADVIVPTAFCEIVYEVPIDKA